MEDIDGGLHPAVDGQSLDEMRRGLTNGNTLSADVKIAALPGLGSQMLTVTVLTVSVTFTVVDIHV